jgi:hypothetical protein
MKDIILSPGDVIDRFTILCLKKQYDCKFFEKEYRLYKGGLPDTVNPELISLVIELAQLNAQIWQLEYEIRMTDNLTDEEIGKRARMTRKTNDKRCEVKEKINQLLGWQLGDRKIYESDR